MTDFKIKRNDTSPAIVYQLQDDDGNPVDISGYNEVRFLMLPRHGSSLTVDDDTGGNVVVDDAANGVVKYEWQSSDTDTAESFKAEWEVEYSDGTFETFPNDNFITVEILKDLG